MNILIINAHVAYAGWSEGRLNTTFMEAAKAFFTERGHQVNETFVEQGYNPGDEVTKHVAADLVILPTPVNWFGAPWIYKKYADEVFNAGLAGKALLEGDGRTRTDPSRQYGTGGQDAGVEIHDLRDVERPAGGLRQPRRRIGGRQRNGRPVPQPHVQL